MCYIDNLEPPLYFSFIVTTFSESSSASDFLAISRHSWLSTFAFFDYLLFLPLVEFIGLLWVRSELSQRLVLYMNPSFS